MKDFNLNTVEETVKGARCYCGNYSKGYVVAKPPDLRQEFRQPMAIRSGSILRSLSKLKLLIQRETR